MRMKSRAGSIVARERGARPVRLVREHFVPEPKRGFHAASSFGGSAPSGGAHFAGGFHGGGQR